MGVSNHFFIINIDVLHVCENQPFICYLFRTFGYRLNYFVSVNGSMLDCSTTTGPSMTSIKEMIEVTLALVGMHGVRYELWTYVGIVIRMELTSSLSLKASISTSDYANFKTLLQSRWGQLIPGGYLGTCIMLNTQNKFCSNSIS